ncbi:DUF1838 family protein [Luteithermobacter gelatinilyticus]|uniref:DUF1838 family protein n=1 Tax=Luteithermobacter gelatinilyticus TaxID=2582913 RepID=UPI001AEF9E97|nr:DUF1838 family protein [Luteithermobacter gelatinilyticus]
MTQKIRGVVRGMILGVCLTGSAVAADNVDLTTPEGAIVANRKIQCSTIDNRPVFYTWQGSAFSRRRGEADQLLFKVSGMNVRQCVTIRDEKRGEGYRLVSREIMIYLDPRTGKIMDRWRNPFLGRDVDVMHVANDPVNQPPSFPYSASAKPVARWYGTEITGSWFMNLTIPLFYHNVLQGEYQKYVGGAYHAAEMFNFMGETANLIDGRKDTAAVKVGWVRVSEWLPWMEMQGREGLVYVHAAGKKLNGYEDLSPELKEYIETRAPAYKVPPPGDDTRPNATTWTVFKEQTRPEKLPRGGYR